MDRKKKKTWPISQLEPASVSELLSMDKWYTGLFILKEVILEYLFFQRIKILLEFALIMETVSKDYAQTSQFKKDSDLLQLMIMLTFRKDLAIILFFSDDHDVWNRVGFYLGSACANLILLMSL